VITEDVVALRTRFALPGMRVLQFGFDGDARNVHLPHNHEREAVIYTGTHDNDTTVGWYATLDSPTLRRVDDYLRVSPGGMPDALIRAALGSVGQLAVLPLQDLLGLGSEARLNRPGTVGSNWRWLLDPQRLTEDLARGCAHLNALYGRSSPP
jgi:4-alpha-glucanotransferase